MVVTIFCKKCNYWNKYCNYEKNGEKKEMRKNEKSKWKRVRGKQCGKPEKKFPVPKVSTYQHFVLLLRNKRGNSLRVANLWSKGLTRADIAQLPATNAHDVLLNRAFSDFRSRDWRQVRSRDFRWIHHIDPPQLVTENLLYTINSITYDK